MTKDNNRKTNSNRNVAIAMGIILGTGIIGFVGFTEFASDPVIVMYYYHFENGTQKWLESDVIVYHDFKNGTIHGAYVGDMIQELKLDTSVQKVIHLKDGTTDYYYKHNDFIGSRTT
jgi:hypothetical protein